MEMAVEGLFVMERTTVGDSWAEGDTALGTTLPRVLRM